MTDWKEIYNTSLEHVARNNRTLLNQIIIDNSAQDISMIDNLPCGICKGRDVALRIGLIQRRYSGEQVISQLNRLITRKPKEPCWKCFKFEKIQESVSTGVAYMGFTYYIGYDTIEKQIVQISLSQYLFRVYWEQFKHEQFLCPTCEQLKKRMDLSDWWHGKSITYIPQTGEQEILGIGLVK